MCDQIYASSVAWLVITKSDLSDFSEIKEWLHGSLDNLRDAPPSPEDENTLTLAPSSSQQCIGLGLKCR